MDASRVGDSFTEVSLQDDSLLTPSDGLLDWFLYDSSIFRRAQRLRPAGRSAEGAGRAFLVLGVHGK